MCTHMNVCIYIWMNIWVYKYTYPNRLVANRSKKRQLICVKSFCVAF